MIALKGLLMNLREMMSNLVGQQSDNDSNAQGFGTFQRGIYP